MKPTRSLSAVIVFLFASPVAVLAQTIGSGSIQVSPTDSPLANNLPFTLIRTTTVVQTLVDGPNNTRTFTVQTARDSEGRTYFKIQQTLHVRADGQPVDWVVCRVSDPVARTRISWDNRTKIANVTPMPAPEVPEVHEARRSQVGRPTQQRTREDLGVRTIAGIEAKGVRTTGVIPAGDLGNDRPLTIVTESWASTKYQIPLLTITNDPRIGKRTDEVTEFQPGEPDPALFQIPNGYIVRKRATGKSD